MRYAILGDIHGNFQALEAVVRVARSIGADRFLQVGDLVGYGADPGPCLQLVRELQITAVAGNHDWAVIGKLDTSFFNAYARAAVEWTRTVLNEEDRRYLERLPLTRLVDDDVEIAHATLYQPELFDYIQTYGDAHRSLGGMRRPVCFIGHSHIPVAFLQTDTLTHTDATAFGLAPRGRALINVGSVGQPRDENPFAAFATYDTPEQRYALHRVPYDVSAAAARIRRAGLPPALGERLLLGR